MIDAATNDAGRDYAVTMLRKGVHLLIALDASPEQVLDLCRYHTGQAIEKRAGGRLVVEPMPSPLIVEMEAVVAAARGRAAPAAEQKPVNGSIFE